MKNISSKEEIMDFINMGRNLETTKNITEDEFEQKELVSKTIKINIKGEENSTRIISVRKKNLMGVKIPMVMLTLQVILPDTRLKNKYMHELAQKGYDVMIVENDFYYATNASDLYENEGILFWKYYINSLLHWYEYINKNKDLYENHNIIGISGAGCAALVSAAVFGFDLNKLIMIDSVCDFEYLIENRLVSKYFKGSPYYKEFDSMNFSMEEFIDNVYKRYPDLKFLNPVNLIGLINAKKLILANNKDDIADYGSDKILSLYKGKFDIEIERLTAFSLARVESAVDKMDGWIRNDLG